MTFLPLIGTIFSRGWSYLTSFLGSILSLVYIVIKMVVDFFEIFINLGGLVDWLIPECLIPLFYITMITVIIKIFFKISKVSSIF